MVEISQESILPYFKIDNFDDLLTGDTDDKFNVEVLEDEFREKSDSESDFESNKSVNSLSDVNINEDNESLIENPAKNVSKTYINKKLVNVPSCKNDSRKQTKKNKDITFHRFPKCRQLSNKWVTAIKRPNWEPNIWSFVCSMHFSASSIYETKGGLRKLVGGAIPELKLEDEAKEDFMEEKLVLLSSISPQLSNPSTNDRVLLSNNETIETIYITMPEVMNDNTVATSIDNEQRERRLKRQITNLQEIAKRRRLRCNALYVQRNRMKKKIASLTKMLADYRQKDLITQKRKSNSSLVKKTNI
ncbi:unnamed protein product, partial [Brenthis ino]